MKIDELTIAEALDIAAMFSGLKTTKPHPFRIGGLYFIRTVTHHHTGKLVEVGDTELVLENAAWIADDGRLSESLKHSTFNEVEMFPAGSRVIIGRAAIIDATEISVIPTSTK